MPAESSVSLETLPDDEGIFYSSVHDAFAVLRYIDGTTLIFLLFPRHFSNVWACFSSISETAVTYLWWCQALLVKWSLTLIHFDGLKCDSDTICHAGACGKLRNERLETKTTIYE